MAGGAGALGSAIRARLDELGLPARRFTAAGYVSAATLSRVLAGQESLRDPSRVAELERGLGWLPGALNAVRRGTAPSTIVVAGWPRADGDWRVAVEAAWAESDASRASTSEAPTDVVDPTQVADLTDFLFRTVHPTGHEERAYGDVSADIRAAGRQLSANELRKLRTGKRTLLDRLDAHALAGAFGVPTSYFFDRVDAARVRDQLAAVAALREAGVERVALRLADLSPDNRRIAEALIEHLRSTEDGTT